MESEEEYVRRASRENFLEAKEFVRDRETRFATSAMQSLQYCVLSNAAAIAAVGAFVGSTGKDVAQSSDYCDSSGVFCSRPVIAGTALAVYVTNDEKNLAETIGSFIRAVQAWDIQLFNDQHRGRARYDEFVRRLLIGVFAAFIVGLIAAVAVIPFIQYRQ